MLDIFLQYLSLLHWLLDYAIVLCRRLQLTSLAVTFFSRLPKRLGFLWHLTTEAGSVGLSLRQMKPLMNEWHCNSRGSTYKVYKLSIPPMWTHWNFRILSCCFGILLECHEKAMVFAGDFNEDESGPIVRSLDLKPGDTAPWMECFFFRIKFQNKRQNFPNLSLSNVQLKQTLATARWMRLSCLLMAFTLQIFMIQSLGRFHNVHRHLEPL